MRPADQHEPECRDAEAATAPRGPVHAAAVFGCRHGGCINVSPTSFEVTALLCVGGGQTPSRHLSRSSPAGSLAARCNLAFQSSQASGNCLLTMAAPAALRHGQARLGHALALCLALNWACSCIWAASATDQQRAAGQGGPSPATGTAAAAAPAAAAPAATVTVNMSRQHPASPLLYGIFFEEVRLLTVSTKAKKTARHGSGKSPD